MGRIVVSEFVSLDGVMEDPGGSEQTRNGGWTFRFDRGPDGDRFKLDEALGAQALLLGRVTYEGFAAAWPSMEGEFADHFNAMPKYVVSSTLKAPTWNNSTVIEGSLPDEIAGLKATLAGDLLVNGSAQLVAGLLAYDLVDEIRLMVFPIVLGGGKRLFGDLDPAKRFELAASTTVGAGILVLTYRSAVA